MITKFKPEYLWFAIFAVTSIAYQLVQDYIRPNYSGDHLTIIYLLGIAPNFFPSIGLPALFTVLISAIRENKTNKWLNSHKHLTANLISMSGLLLWEFLQPITKNGQFDWHDVLWTIIGALIFHLIWITTPVKYR
jgi:hypothetical protein